MRSIGIASSSGWHAISDAGPGLRPAATTVLLAGLLLLPALANGFPLVFPDSGTYLGIATGHDYAIDRSSVYGLMLKPFVIAVPGVAGLWLAIGVQVIAVAAVLTLAARALMSEPSASPITTQASATRSAPQLQPPRMPRSGKDWSLLPLALVAVLTSLPWHAAQFMPDAFTGPLVLLACLGATRRPSAPGAALLWAGALVLALTHYTHIILLAAVAIAATIVQIPLGLGWRAAMKRVALAVMVTASAAGLLAVANGAALGRLTMSPLGPVFLFARLHEDGLVDPWFDRHCGRDAPAALCAERGTIANDSQALLWRDPDGPVARHVWQPGSDAERWRWVGMMAAADRGAILDQPAAFLISALRGTGRQLVAFQAMDDECPANCGRDPSAGVAYALARDRPSALRPLQASMQLRGTTPKAMIRMLTTPIAALGLILLPVAALIAFRRRDALASAFIVGSITALLVNAALAGTLSDVHDRYQSRIVWLAPLLILCLAQRWRRRPACPPPLPGA